MQVFRVLEFSPNGPFAVYAEGERVRSSQPLVRRSAVEHSLRSGCLLFECDLEH